MEYFYFTFFLYYKWIEFRCVCVNIKNDNINFKNVKKRNQPLFRLNQNFKKSIGFLKLDIFKMSKMKKSNKVLKKMFKKMGCDENGFIYKKS